MKKKDRYKSLYLFRIFEFDKHGKSVPSIKYCRILCVIYVYFIVLELQRSDNYIFMSSD